MSSNKNRDLPEKLRKDPIFDGYINKGDKDFAAYTGGGISSQIDLSKFDKPLDNKLSDIQKAMLPKPKRVQAVQPIKKIPVKNIKQSPGKGKTLLKSEASSLKDRLNKSIERIEKSTKVEKGKGLYRRIRREQQKLGLKKAGIKTLAGTAGGAALGGAVGGPVGAGLGGIAGGTIGSTFEKPKSSSTSSTESKMKKGETGKTIGSAIGHLTEEVIKRKLMKKSESNISKSQAYLKVEKSISRMQGYSPMTNSEVRKSFNGQIPEIMKDVKGRPSTDWWNKAISKSSLFTNTPNEYAIGIWYGIQKSEAPWIKETSREEPRRSFDEEGKLSELEEETGSEEVKKVLPLLPLAAGFIGAKLLGKCSDGIKKSGGNIESIDSAELGNAIIQVIEELLRDSGEDEEKIIKQTESLMGRAMRQASLNKQERPAEEEDFVGKAVAEPTTFKIIDMDKPKDFGGQSEVVNPTISNTKSLTPSKKVVTD